MSYYVTILMLMLAAVLGVVIVKVKTEAAAQQFAPVCHRARASSPAASSPAAGGADQRVVSVVIKNNARSVGHAV